MRKTSLKRLVGDRAARLVLPSKESAWRWSAYVEVSGHTIGAQGDTPEEACDNLRDLMVGHGKARG